jgi:KipI family sensor histidine kinase inhibitor
MTEIVVSSDRSVLAYFGMELSGQAHAAVVQLLHALRSEPIAGVTSVSPGYVSVMVRFDPLRMEHAEIAERLRILSARAPWNPPDPRQHTIPVCYEPEFAPDIERLAHARGLTPQQVVERHQDTLYRVYFLGFVPGFAYMGDVAPIIAAPRLETPRKSVPPGSVGIAGRQTGIYPVATPGGWNLIGRSPVRLFQSEPEPESLLLPGDRVCFQAIGADEFRGLESS